MHTSLFFRMSLKLPLLMFAMAVLAMLATGFVAYRVAHTALLDQGIARISATTQDRSEAVQDWVGGTLDDVAFQVTSPNVINALRAFEGAWSSTTDDPEGYARDAYVTQNPNVPAEFDALNDAGDRTSYSRNHRKYHGFFQTIARKRGYQDVFLIGREGAVLYSVFKTDDFGRASTPQTLSGAVDAALAAEDGQAGMTDFRLDANGVPVIEFAALIRDGGGNPMGTLVYRVPGDALRELVSDTLATMSGGGVFLRGSDGTAITSDGTPAEPDTAEQIEVTHLLDSHDLNWVIGTQTPKATLIEPATELLRTLINQGALVLAVMTLAGIFMGRGIARPLERVRAATAGIANGALNTEIPEIRRRDEIGAIARTLQDFRDKLSAGDAAREESLQKSSAMDASSAAMMILRPNGAIIYGNPAVRDVLALLGLSMTDAPDTHVPDWFPEDIRAAIATQSTQGASCHAVRAGVSLSLTLDAVRTETGDLGGWVLEWADVTHSHKGQAVLATLDAHQIRATFSPDGEVLEGNENWTALGAQQHDQGHMSGVLARIPGLDWTAISTGAHWSGHINLEAAKGACVIQGSLSPVRDIDGTVRSILLLGADVTQADQALKSAAATRKSMEAAQAEVVENLRAGLARLSQGDLTTTLDMPFPKDYEQLALDFNTATATLASALSDVAHNSTTIQSQSEDISASAARLANQGEAQAAALQQTSTTMATLAASAETAARQAKQSNLLAMESSKDTHTHSAVLNNATAAMQAILDSSKEIGEIVAVIEGIAFQTNLLALNAGVEAARAGPAGRGFAVVATEVRALAQRSSEAASQISALIEASSVHVQNGVALFQDTGQALQAVGASVSQMSTQMNGIAISGEEQSRAISEVNMSVSDVDRSTQENAAMFEQTSAASRILLAQSEALMRTLSRFTIEASSQSVPLKAAG